MHSGFYIRLESINMATTVFVAPAIVAETVAALITMHQDQDPADELNFKIWWGENALRPFYSIQEATALDRISHEIPS